MEEPEVVPPFPDSEFKGVRVLQLVQGFLWEEFRIGEGEVGEPEQADRAGQDREKHGFHDEPDKQQADREHQGDVPDKR